MWSGSLTSKDVALAYYVFLLNGTWSGLGLVTILIQCHWDLFSLRLTGNFLPYKLPINEIVNACEINGLIGGILSSVLSLKSA